jgi:DNA-binding Lrp family transcriptional regulator
VTALDDRPAASARPPYTPADRYLPGARPVLLTGVQAIARMLVEQHARDARTGRRTASLVSGYPGSPLGGLDKLLAGLPSLKTDHGVHLVPGLNEELGATAVWGSQQVPGQGDLLVRVACRSTDDLQRVVHSLLSTPGVVSTTTQVVLTISRQRSCGLVDGWPGRRADRVRTGCRTAAGQVHAAAGEHRRGDGGGAVRLQPQRRSSPGSDGSARQSARSLKNRTGPAP